MVCFATEDIHSSKYLVQDNDLKLVHHRRKRFSINKRNIEKAENNMDKHDSLLKITSPNTIMKLEQGKQSEIIPSDFVHPTLNIYPKISSTNKEANSNDAAFNNIQLFTTPSPTRRFHPYRKSVHKVKPSSSNAEPTNLIIKASPLRIELNEHEKLHRENKRREMMKVFNLKKTSKKIFSEVDDTELPLNLSVRSVETNIIENQSNNEQNKNKLFQIYKQEQLEKYCLEKEEQLFTKYIKQKNSKTPYQDMLLQMKSTEKCLDYTRSSVIASGMSKLETNGKVECL